MHRLAFRKDFHMQRAVSAGLLSALVFPGAGHLYLRRGRRACIFLLPTLAALFVLAGDIAQRASVLADQVMAGTLAPDPAAIAARLQTQGGTSGLDIACSAVLVACWLGSIIDSVVIARAGETARA
jgi:TM2 domain-containing membrane protein YozV